MTAVFAAAALAVCLSGCVGLNRGNVLTEGAARVASPITRLVGTFPIGTPNQPLDLSRRRQDSAFLGDDREPLVALAISGGGSRSAYYAAGVMEQLSRIPAPGDPRGRSVLDCVRIISTVSGGGLPGAYFALHHRERRQPGFFDRFKATMATNLQWRTYGHLIVFPPLALQLLRPDITRTDLLAAEIEQTLGKGPATFDTMLEAENRPDDPAPALIVNGTVYNSGQRLCFTNLPASRFPTLLDNAGVFRGSSPADGNNLRRLAQPLTFEDFGSDIGSFRLARALAASAAYPVMLAPVPLWTYGDRVPPDDIPRSDPSLLRSPRLYVADGGLVENEGIDPLLSILRTLPRRRPVIIVVIDGTTKIEIMNLGPGKVWGPLGSINRMYEIGSLRPLALYGAVAARFHDADRLDAFTIRLEGESIAADRFVQSIPTAFRLADRHRSALDRAAVANTAKIATPMMAAFQSAFAAPRGVGAPSQGSGALPIEQVSPAVTSKNDARDKPRRVATNREVSPDKRRSMSKPQRAMRGGRPPAKKDG